MIEFKRNMSGEFLNGWSNKENSGLRVVWHYEDLQTDNALIYEPKDLGEYYQDNRNFIIIANIIYQEDFIVHFDEIPHSSWFEREYLTQLLDAVSTEKRGEKHCIVGEFSPAMERIISEKYDILVLDLPGQPPTEKTLHQFDEKVS